MDIIDIMLARAMTPQGKTETYVSIANAAAAKAAKAEEDAEAAIATVTAAAEDIAAAQESASQLLEDAQSALETAQQAQLNIPTNEDIDAEVKKLNLSASLGNTNAAKLAQVVTTYPDNSSSTITVTKLYKSTGNNEDGTMTQKAITDVLATKANSSDVATKQYVNNAISNITIHGGGSGGISNLGSENAGEIVIVGEDGNITAGDITEEQLIEALIRAGIYQPKDAVGLDMNYSDRSFVRIQEANGLSSGENFNVYSMYGGRVRCNVDDNGNILAFYGENSYRDDGSNGQVMIYQPKFYYQRTPLRVDNAVRGQIIRQETLIISPTKQSGFKLHPLFDAGNGEEYNYVLLSAYEGSIDSSKMQSIAGVQPTTNMTIAQAETYATARGAGWHIMNMAAVSANQMLEIVEFGSPNGQTSLENGICNLTYTANKNCSAITGSTSSLGNATGHATSTTSNNNGTLITNTDVGKRAISYRGMENPWGNVWSMIGGANIYGDGKSGGGALYICKDFDYTPSIISSNYEYIGFNIPSTYNWINAFGYGEKKYDWVFIPIECSSTANSLVPIGDNLWTVGNVNENKIVAVGGTYEFVESDGPFYYACDRNVEGSFKHNYGARLMYVPTKNTTYDLNISKWQTYMGG